jgi:radical SAM superfamily enzyme YgiQ (UPF0313 family)
MASCRERLGVDSFVLFGESLADDREATLALCRAVVERAQGCRWVTNARADAVDAGLASALAGAGCALVALGLESGDQGVLERAGKGTAPEDARRAVRALRDAGVMSLGFFVLGLPGETERTARSTIELATSLDLDLAEFYPAVPFPGTPLAREVEARGVSLGPEAWPLLEYGRVHGLEGASALADPRGWARRAYLRFYADPARLGRLAALGGAGALGAACDWARSRLGP